MTDRASRKRGLSALATCIAVIGLAWSAQAEARTGATAAGSSASLLTPTPGTDGSRGGTSEGGAPKIAPVQTDLGEAFDDITLLPGAGWFFQNNSSPVGLTNWFQGNDTVFPAHTGAPTSYIGANFNNVSGANTISNWMLTPQLPLKNGDTVSFWTRTSAGSIWPDRLEVRLSLSGASTNVGTLATDVGDFTTLLLSVNPTLVAGGYPEVWTQFTATLSGIPAASTGRIGFRYFVTNGGPSGSNSNYIGIDTFEFVEALVPSISLTKTVGTAPGVCAATNAIAVPAGTTVYYCYTVQNTGTATLNLHDLVDDRLGAIFSGLSYSLTPGSSVDTVAAGLSIPAVMNATTTNTATWTAYNTGPVNSVQAQASATVTVLQPANVFGTKTVSGSYVPGGTITYTIVLSNTGAGAQGDNAGDELTDALPASLTATGATASSGTVTRVGNLVTWNGSIPAGGSVTITITATVNAVAFGTTISNQGTISYDATGGGTNGATRLTDDPGVAGAANPTVFLVADPTAIPGLQPVGLAALALLTALAAAFALRRMA